MSEYRRNYIQGGTFFITLVTYNRKPLWEYSSFNKWVDRGVYSPDWCCSCSGKKSKIPDFPQVPE